MDWRLASGRRWAAWVCCVLALLALDSACAQTPSLPPAIQAGAAWLNGQVQGDGSLSSEGASIATPFQARQETLLTLHALSSVPGALGTNVAAATDGNTEYVARQVLAAAATSQPAGSGVSALLALQNADGGWGLATGYQSDALDTAFALQALAAANVGSTTAVANALGRLPILRQSDGGWGIGGQSSIYITSNVLLAANAWSSRYAVSATTTASRDWLLAQRDGAQKYASVLDNALALRALATQTSQASVLQPISDALNGAQQADGSWLGDPYLTAVSLDALWFVAQPTPNPTTGDVQGKVVDQSTQAALSGATLQLVENASSTSTAADGTFAFAGLAPGTYTLRISMLGYQMKSFTLQVAAGQVLNIGSIGLVPAPLTASVSGVIKNNSGQVLANVIVSVGTVTTFTDATGTYQLAGIPPGSAIISAELPNYQTASATVAFAAGTSYLFSPTLYPTNVTPPPTSLQGIIIDAATHAAIAGASVVLNGVAKTTDAAGKFSFTGLTAGQFTLDISAANYQGVSATGTLVAGLNDVGKIALPLKPQSSTLSGKVTDADSHAPIAGATVAVQGQSLNSITDATGAYSIAGIVGTSLTMSVSANGYLAQAFSVALPQPGPATVDFQLTRPAASGISFDSVTMGDAVYPAHDVAELFVHVSNATSNAASLVIGAQVLDAQGNIAFEFQANAKGFGQNPPNLPLLVPANGGLDIKMTQAMLRQPAGTYAVRVVAIDPAGRIAAEGETHFDVSAGAILGGGLVPDPPLAQIGTNQPITLSADLNNVGNVPLDAGSLDLKIVLQNADTQTSTVAQAAVSRFVTGVPMNTPHGLAVDATGNLYTANLSDTKVVAIDASGVQSVLANLPQNNGTPVLARDAQGNLWVAGTSTAKVFEISPQGAVSNITLTQLFSISGIESAANGDLLFTGTYFSEQRLVSRNAQGQETVLWRNGLSTPESLVKDDAGNYVVTNYGDNTLAKISSTGAITPFVAGLNRPLGITRDAQGNFYVANNGGNSIIKVTPTGQLSTYASGLKQPYDLKFDAAGNLLVTNQGDNSLVKVLPNGTVQDVARGIANGPEGMKYDAAGNLWIANDDGSIRRKDAQDVVTVEATGLSSPKGLAIDAAGNVLVANYANGVVSKLRNGTVSTFASGLQNPYGVAVDGSGNAYVTERTSNRISSFDAAGNRLGAVESVLYYPGQTNVGPSGDVYIRNNDSITIVQGGVARMLARNLSPTYMVADPAGGGVYATTGYDVYRIANDGTSTHINTTRLPFYSYGLGVAADGRVVLSDYSNKRLQKLDASGNLTVFAQLSNPTQNVLTDLAGNVYVRLDNENKVYAIDASGTARLVPITVTEAYEGLGIGTDGKLLEWTVNDHVYSIDPATGAATLLLTAPGIASYGTGIARDAAGNIYMCASSLQEFRTYSPAGTLASTLSGFVAPWDIVWTGSDMRFVDSSNRFYSLAPGGYPVKLGTFNAYFLAASGGEIYGSTASNGIIHWTGTAQETWKSISGTSLYGGIAARADRALTVGDPSASRVLTLDVAKNIVNDFVGLVNPAGLALDNQGQIYVSNFNAGTIARLDSSGRAPALFIREANASFLVFDAAGNLWVSRSNGVDRVDPAGTLSVISNSGTFTGLLIDGSDTLALDGSNAQLRRWDGQTWKVLAAGLSSPMGLHATAAGDVYIANHGNGTVSRYSAGALSSIGSGMTGVNVVTSADDGNVYAAGDLGALYQIAPDATITKLNVASGVNKQSFYGLVMRGNTQLSGVAGNNIYNVKLIQPVAPPPAGTIVFQTTLPMPAMPAADGYTHFDLGSWLPTYGGDFRIDVSRAGADGGATNFVHVGPAASGSISELAPILPPGDQTEPMCLSLNGADFTSISRVETAQVRPLVNSGQPNGMAADKAGNLYHTDAHSLFRTTPQGQTTQIAANLTLSFGLAADSNENLYAAALNSSSGHFDLLRFDASGAKTVVADLGVTQANGVQVDSRDQILVGSPNKLLRVTQQGQVSVITTQGLPQPRGIAIDGKDNVYVQNEANYVSLVRPDGSVSDIFTLGDGITDPSFEGDGYPNIAADCSDNFYIAPSNWQKLGKNVQLGEEHTLAQVIPRTGQISLLFDALKINPSLGDIDYLAYDRFGSRILMWNHNDQKVWQVPVTCGAISVDAHLLTAPGQTLRGMTVPQSAAVALPSGGTEYVWSFKDVTASGEQVCFDTTLTGLTLGETRQTLDSAYITFQNSFAANNVHETLDVPSVHVDNLVQLGVITDQADYAANSTAQVTTTLTNANAAEVSGALSVNVYDAQNVLVGGVTQQGVSIPAQGSLPVAGTFAIGTILPAQYTVKAVLSGGGIDLARATTQFNVLPDNVGASATSTLHTDKQSYNANDQVLISSRAISQSANVILGNLTLMVQVFDANGTLQFTHGYSIDQLLPGAIRDFSVTQKLVNAAPGIYTVKQDLTDDQGRAFDHTETAFNVSASSDTGFGLSGAIAATPKSLAVGDTVTLSATATNHGNSAFDNLPLTIAIVDPVTNAIVQQFGTSTPVAIGASVPFNTSWATQGQAGATYFAVLSATVGSGGTSHSVTLAVDTFELSAPTTHLDASIMLTPTSPPMAALVLVDTTVPAAQTARIRAELTALGYATTFVDSANAFGSSVRSGAYQLYLLLATQVTPDATTQRLLREAVHRGEGLLVANGAAALPEVLAQITGLKASVALPVINAQSLDVAATAPGGAAHASFNPALAGRIVAAQVAQTQATFTGRLPATPDAGALSTVVANLGRADLGYYVNDSGTNGTHLALASVGRLRNAGGADVATVWRIRNSGDTTRNVVLSSTSVGFTMTLAITGHTETYIASSVVAGTASHSLSENSTVIQTATALASVFSDARSVDAGDNPGAIALWANAIGTSGALQWTGAQHELHGAIHSNSDIKLAGAQNLIDGPVHYVSGLQNSGSQNTFTFQPRQVAPQPLPTLLNVDDFKPGGPIAQALGAQYLDQSAECASKHTWQRQPKQPLPAGVYWIPCDAQISGADSSGNVTLVSTGSIQISGARAAFQPFYQGVQFASSSNGNAAVQLSGSSATIGGLVFAPRGSVQLSGSSMNLKCAVVANQIQLSGAKTVVDARQCASATIQEQVPALALNAFGAGTAAYAAFDWQGAISQYEGSAPGTLSTLFGNVTNHVGPTQNPLRAGAVISLAAAVTNLADPFTGAFKLAANDDSLFVPPSTTWPLDFSSHNAFQAASAIRLGSGGATTITGTVSAATPLVIDPLKQASVTVPHLAGESIGDLQSALNAVSNRDAGLNAALFALQAAQSSLAANDREGAIGHLLDAAESCGQSANAQADALRTRIDWVIWADTH